MVWSSIKEILKIKHIIFFCNRMFFKEICGGLHSFNKLLYSMEITWYTKHYLYWLALPH